MRRKKETNLNSDPTSKTRACTNNSENVTGSQETRVRTVGNGEETQSGRWDGGWFAVDKRELKRGGIVEVKRSQKIMLASTFVSYVYESMRRKRDEPLMLFSS